MTDAGGSSAHSGDARPRPQYGEYATAEEQRARIRLPDATDALSAGQAPATVATAAPTPSVGGAAALGARRAGGGVVDRVVTLVLLGLGFLHVIIVAPMLFVFDRSMIFLLDAYGYDPAGLTDTTDLRLGGVFAASALIALWLLAAATSWWSLRRRRLSFWIPLVAAALAIVAMNLFLEGPLSREPLIEEFLTGYLGTGR